MITGKKVLARISSTPGKTQLINHFLINDKWYLVDLPGYGFAKTAKVNRRQWETMIEDYLIRRENLMSAFVLVDSRLEMQEIDRQVINWFGEHGIHFTLLFTKADKLSPNQLSSNLGRYKTELLKDWESLPPIILTSAKSRLGREEILQFITGTNQLFRLSDQDRS